MDEWVGTQHIAAALNVSVSTVKKSFADAATADQWYGPGKWRRKPLTARRDMQVKKSRLLELAAEAIGNLGDDDGPSPV